MGKPSKYAVPPTKSKVETTPTTDNSNEVASTSSKGGVSALTWPIIILIVAIVAYVWKSRGGVDMSVPVEDLMNAPVDILKTKFFGDGSYLFYCDRSKRSEIIPESFVRLNGLYNSKMGFAKLNCSQKLPSGHTIWEKFKLKREMRPTVFGVAPWMKPTQVPLDMVKGKGKGKSLQKFVDTSMKPQATMLLNDNDFTRHCGFTSKNFNTNSTTCMIIVKGSKYSSTQEAIEEKLVQKYAKQMKFGKISGTSASFNFEKQPENKNDEVIPPMLSIPSPKEYAMRVYAIRDGRHYLPMTYSPTLNYMETFITHALNVPTDDFTSFNAVDSTNSIRLERHRTSAFKQRAGSSYSSDTYSSASTEEEEQNARRLEEARLKREQRRKEKKQRELEMAERKKRASEAGLLEEEELVDPVLEEEPEERVEFMGNHFVDEEEMDEYEEQEVDVDDEDEAEMIEL